MLFEEFIIIIFIILGATAGGVQVLFLVLHLGITPRKLVGEPSGVLGFKPGLATYKASALATIMPVPS